MRTTSFMVKKFLSTLSILWSPVRIIIFTSSPRIFMPPLKAFQPKENFHFFAEAGAATRLLHLTMDHPRLRRNCCGFCAVLVFAYWLQGPPQRAPFADLHLFRLKHYAFVAVELENYVAFARPRSAKWQTISVPNAQFTGQVRDIASFL